MERIFIDSPSESLVSRTLMFSEGNIFSLQVNCFLQIHFVGEKVYDEMKFSTLDSFYNRILSVPETGDYERVGRLVDKAYFGRPLLIIFSFNGTRIA